MDVIYIRVCVCVWYTMDGIVYMYPLYIHILHETVYLLMVSPTKERTLNIH